MLKDCAGWKRQTWHFFVRNAYWECSFQSAVSLTERPCGHATYWQWLQCLRLQPTPVLFSSLPTACNCAKQQFWFTENVIPTQIKDQHVNGTKSPEPSKISMCFFFHSGLTKPWRGKRSGLAVIPGESPVPWNTNWELSFGTVGNTVYHTAWSFFCDNFWRPAEPIFPNSYLALVWFKSTTQQKTCDQIKATNMQQVNRM